MGVVVASHSMSLDGFIVRADRTPGPLHDWLWSGDRPSRHGEDFKLSAPSRDWLDAGIDRVGATVAGRRTYEDSGRWVGQLPFDWPFFIVTHEPPEDADEVSFTFVTEGVEPAIEAAKSAAGDKDVSLMGGEIVRQALAARLLDEVAIDLVPILLGDGVRLFDESAQTVELEPTQVVQVPGMTHNELPRREVTQSCSSRTSSNVSTLVRRPEPSGGVRLSRASCTRRASSALSVNVKSTVTPASRSASDSTRRTRSRSVSNTSSGMNSGRSFERSIFRYCA
jgi:dihydrofolate reductase